MKKFLLIVFLITLFAQTSFAVIDAYTFDNPRQEAQYRALIEEFRCPKCQNQNLAGSDAPIAQDLKKKTYDMVKDGRSDTEIRNYMYERYGDFISYKPPVRPSTWILWFLPPVILLIGVIGWLLRQRYKRKPVITDDVVTNTENLVNLSDSERQRLEALLHKNSDIYSHPTSTSPKE